MNRFKWFIQRIINMRVYIENYAIQNVGPKLHLLHKYFVSALETIEIYSPEGLFVIDESKVYKLNNITDVPLNRIQTPYTNIYLIIDQSHYIKEEVHQVPFQHVKQHITSLVYSIQPELQLIIECKHTSSNKFSHFSKNNYDHFIPHSMYFTNYQNDKINGVLSLLI
jgi:hypothetical protein